MNVVLWTSDWTAWTYLKLKDNVLIAEDCFVLLTMLFYETFIYGWETRIKNQKERPVKGCFFIKTVSIVTNHISVQQTCTNQLPLRHVKLMKTKQMREWNLNFHFFERTFFRIEAVENYLTMQQNIFFPESCSNVYCKTISVIISFSICTFSTFLTFRCQNDACLLLEHIRSNRF